MRNEDLIREVEQFLYREARLLDDRRFHEWITLFTDDVRYWMSGRSNRYPKSSKAIAILDPDRYVEDDQTMEDVDGRTQAELRARVGARRDEPKILHQREALKVLQDLRGEWY